MCGFQGGAVCFVLRYSSFHLTVRYVVIYGMIHCNIRYGAVCLVSLPHIAPGRAFMKTARYVLFLRYGSFYWTIRYVVIYGTVSNSGRQGTYYKTVRYLIQDGKVRITRQYGTSRITGRYVTF